MLNYYDENKIEVGLDESGAGSMIGDLYVSAVILPKECPKNEKYWNLIKDSKKLSKKKRELLYDYIKEISLDYSIISISKEEIEEINIRNSRKKGFVKALENLKLKPELILIDGDVFDKYKDIEHICIKGGDNKYRNIAAASILAKVSRDKNILGLDKEYPEYNWKNNQGYGTKEHLNIIKEKGITPYHRKTYGICKNY